MTATARSPRFDIAARIKMLEHAERYTELPLLALSFVMIPLLIGPPLWDLTTNEAQVFYILDAIVWAMFAIDLVVKIVIAPSRLQYVRSHLLDVIVVAVPFFRPLRILRVFLFGSRILVGGRRLVGVDYLLVYALGIVIISGTIVASVEGGEGSSIRSFPDALWWSFVTVSTVGYGDMFPITIAGRAVAVVLMLTGIGLFGGLAANVASMLIRTDEADDEPMHDLLTEIRLLRHEVAELRQSNQ